MNVYLDFVLVKCCLIFSQPSDQPVYLKVKTSKKLIELPYTKNAAEAAPFET